jgi:hypothetical protein
VGNEIGKLTSTDIEMGEHEDDDDVQGHGSFNDNETVVEDGEDVEGHALTFNDNETVVEEDDDVEGHTAFNDNETVVED